MHSNWISKDILSRIGPSPDVRVVRTSTGREIDVLHIDSLPRLVQAVGYLKYRPPSGASYLRGQHSLYNGTVEPTLLRGRRNITSAEHALSELIRTSSDWKCTHPDHRPIVCPEKLLPAPRSARRLFKAGVPRYAAEPLLQHYGIRTHWIDVVDNLWVALWFACHKFVRAYEFTHIVRRNLADGGEDSVYIITVNIPGDISERRPGLYGYDNGTRVIDLRKAAPSFYLRPHAQHGLLIRPRTDDGALDLAAFQIPLASALEWLGSSVLLSPFGLYPPASVDEGYRRLLDSIKHIAIHGSLGNIDVVGPGY